jgi:hypothetical protein
VLALEVGEPEDDVVGVGDGDAEALQEEAEEVGPPVATGLVGRVVRREREADVNFERREVKVVEKVFLALE